MRHRARLIAALTLTTAVAVATVQPSGAVRDTVDTARYILPPGDYGGFPTSDHSFDQLPLYDGLTPLRDHVKNSDLAKYYIPENLAPIGTTHVEPTGRPGTTIVYDQYGIPHVTGKTRADLAFGAGWVTARDRSLLIQLGRGPARVAVDDIPGINAFGLVTSGQSFVPSAQTEQFLNDQVRELIATYGDKGRQIVADAQAEADGVNAYFAAHGIDEPPLGVNDVIAVTAFIGSIFGAGGGAEASNADFLARLQQQLGTDRGYQAWDDAMQLDDPEAPTTTSKRFDYPMLTGGPVTGSVPIDAGSIVSFDPRNGAAPASRRTAPITGTPAPDAPFYPAAGPVPYKQASNFLVVNQQRSASGNGLAVMGPQLGYYYPEIVEQIHLTGPGVDAQGAAVPGLAMYILIGRTRNYAWSLTSANQDVRDVFAEQLCNPDGSTPTRSSNHYMFKGVCMPFTTFDAGALNGQEITYPVSVHGPVIGTALSNGRPVALTRQRSTYGKDGLNLAALKDMTDGAADTPDHFWTVANEFGFTFNWGYVNRTDTAYFSSGLLPVRAAGLDRRLPTSGTGDYEWQGYLTRDQHPHDVAGPNGLLLNWNNKSAPGFMHGDDAPFGAVHRVEMFNRFPDKVTLANDVGIMNRAATQDTRSIVWPVVSRVLHGSAAPNARDAKVLRLLDAWVNQSAPRLDADNNGFYDTAGPTIMDALWGPLATSVMQPVFGNLTSALDGIRGLGGLSGESYVDKDLRTLLGDPVAGPMHLHYCGNGVLAACRSALWSVLDTVTTQLTAQYGSDPATWRSTASRTGFAPGLVSETMRSTNRPTFQQVIEFDRAGARRT